MEFVLEEGITDEEAVKLIETPPSTGAGREKKGDGWVQTKSDTFQMLQFDENQTVDPFTVKLVNFEVKKKISITNQSVSFVKNNKSIQKVNFCIAGGGRRIRACDG